MLKVFPKNSFIYFLSFLSLTIFSCNYSFAAKKMLTIENWDTNNQIPVYFTATSWLPIIDIAITFNAGSARDGNFQGIAYLTNKILAKNLSSHYENDLDTAGVIVTTRVNRDLATIHIRSTTQPAALNKMLQILQDDLSHTNFEQEVVNHTQVKLLNKISDLQQSYLAMGKSAVYQHIYPNHPYGHSPLGTNISVESITPQALKNFQAKYYVANNAMLAIVGAVDRNQAQQIAEKIMAGLKSGKPAIALAVAKIEQSKTGLVHLPVTASTQSDIFFGSVAVSPLSTDYFPLLVANHILGHGATISYLGKELRVKRGLSYRIFSKVIPLAANGLWMIGFQTRTVKVTESIDITKEVLNNFIKAGVPVVDVDAAKKFLIGHLPLTFYSNKNIVDRLTYLGFYKLPLDYFDTYHEKINQVTAEQVKKVFQKYGDPSKAVIIVAG